MATQQQTPAEQTPAEQTPADQALPPKTRRKKSPPPTHCLNCGAAATGKFCAQCGQEIKDHSVSLGPLLSEGLAELASWDSKLFRTLIPLLIRPGFLTNEYNAGRRVPYLSPLKLYLTISVLFFCCSRGKIRLEMPLSSALTAFTPPIPL